MAATASSSWFSNLPHTWNAPMQPERTPLFIIPSINITLPLAMEGGQGQASTTTPELEFYFLKLSFWFELTAVLIGLLMVAVVVGSILYHYCVVKPSESAQQQNTTTSTSSYLVGYGIILPFWLIFPAIISHALGVQNKILRFMFTTCVTSICAFRTTGAIHGFSPDHATKSMKDFLFYYAAPIPAKYDIKTQQYVRNTRSQRLQNRIRFLKSIFWLGMMSSMFQMFPEYLPSLWNERDLTTATAASDDRGDDVWYDWRTIFNLQNLINNLLLAAYFQVHLTTFTEGMMMIQCNMTHIEVEQTMNNPVFESKCPSEFWGRRWNRIIHDVLKRGVFLPVKHHLLPKGRYSDTVRTTCAVLATFFASGIFHEWLQITVFPSWDHTITPDDGKCYLNGYEEPVSSIHCYKPKWGVSMAFFMWQAGLVAIEFALRPYFANNKKLLGLLNAIPGPIQTCLTILAGGCVGHWFYEPYIHSNFFLDGDAAMFFVKRRGT